MAVSKRAWDGGQLRSTRVGGGGGGDGLCAGTGGERAGGRELSRVGGKYNAPSK